MDEQMSTSGASWHTERVPSRAPLPDMPPRVAAVQRVLSSTTRMVCLLDVLAHPGSQRSEIQERTGLSSAGVRFALRDLEETEHIVTDIEDGASRVGKRVHYSARATLLSSDLVALREWMIR